MSEIPATDKGEPSDYDTAWKEALELYFEAFIEFFFPLAHAGIDWTKGYEFLDKELAQIAPEAETGKRHVDKLVKLWRIGGEETWVLIHVEIQSQVEADFPQRMYVYNYKLFDRYQRQVASLAVLGDTQADWRPSSSSYGYTLFGCTVSLQFPIVKLLDYNAPSQDLETSRNPFAVLVMAHLKAQSTRRNPQQRYQWKLTLVKGLYDKGYTREEILSLFRFINWIMTLPGALEQQLATNLIAYEEEKQMPYITPFERFATERGIEQGIEQGIERGVLRGQQDAVIEVLQVRFEPVPVAVIEAIRGLTHIDSLKTLLRQAIAIPTLDAFQTLLLQTSRDALINTVTTRFPDIPATLLEQLQQLTDVMQLQTLYQRVMQGQATEERAVLQSTTPNKSVQPAPQAISSVELLERAIAAPQS